MDEQKVISSQSENDKDKGSFKEIAIFLLSVPTGVFLMNLFSNFVNNIMIGYGLMEFVTGSIITNGFVETYEFIAFSSSASWFHIVIYYLSCFLAMAVIVIVVTFIAWVIVENWDNIINSCKSVWNKMWNKEIPIKYVENKE